MSSQPSMVVIYCSTEHPRDNDRSASVNSVCKRTDGSDRLNAVVVCAGQIRSVLAAALFSD